MSEKAKQVLERIRALQQLTQRNGVITKAEQIQLLLTLDNSEMLLVADRVFSTPLSAISRGAR